MFRVTDVERIWCDDDDDDDDDDDCHHRHHRHHHHRHHHQLNIHFLQVYEGLLPNSMIWYNKVSLSKLRLWQCDLALFSSVNHGPVLPDRIMLTALGNQSDKSVSIELPSWIKSTAKMLNGGSEGEDWSTLATKLGESSTKFWEFVRHSWLNLPNR